jgi:hypothetical protein
MGIPMYAYFGIGVALAGMAVLQRLRARFPGISNAAAYGVVFVLACLFDFAVAGAVRLVAVIDFCATTLFVVYHLPFNWFGTDGDSVAALPSYLLPGR